MNTRPRRLLIAGDAVKHTGFARVVEALAAVLAALGWDVAIMALNWHGDHTELARRYRMYPAATDGTVHGFYRLSGVIAQERPDVVLIVNDPNVVDTYLEALESSGLPALPPIVAYMPMDGMGINPAALGRLPHLAAWVAYTEFGLRELAEAVPGLAERPAAVIPHGIDLGTFAPVDRAAARAEVNLPERFRDGFGVLLVDRNGPRKALDAAFRAFARFAETAPDAFLVYHGAAKDEGWDLDHLAERLGIERRVILTGGRWMTPGSGVTVEAMRTIYSLADVKLSSAWGEGWGLTTMEAMACGVPCVVPDFAALGEWAADGALLVRVDSEEPVTAPGGLNVEYHPARIRDMAEALGYLYAHPAVREALRARGLALVAQERYRWETIGAHFDRVLSVALAERLAAEQAARAERVREHVVEAADRARERLEAAIGGAA